MPDLIFENWRKWLNLDEASILKNKNPFKALFILGPAGAGKSTVSKIIGIPKNFQISNPDEYIEKIFPVFGISMKFVDASNNHENVDLETLQQASRKILQRANIEHTTNLISIASPLIFDTTGEDIEKAAKKMNLLTNIGYDIGIIIINVPPQLSVVRDKERPRTVGPERTLKISNAFQDNVVLNKSYHKIADSNPSIQVLGDIYPNIFDLQTGKFSPGINPEMLNSFPQFRNISIEYAKEMLGKIKSDLRTWIASGVMNEKGKIVLEGMKALVKASKGQMGQNINDIPVALANKDFQKIPEIRRAAEVLVGDIKNIISQASGKNKDIPKSGIRKLTQR